LIWFIHNLLSSETAVLSTQVLSSMPMMSQFNICKTAMII
jgi:hypothetical protein